MITPEYLTKDFYLAAYLLSCGIELHSHERFMGLTTFIFTNSERLQELVEKYHSLKALVNPITYGNSLRMLKSIIHTESTSKPKSQYVEQYREHTK